MLYDVCMTDEQTALVQARLTEYHARQVDQDIVTLGLRSRSEAVREGLRLLHHHAEQDALAHEYDKFYGNQEAPLTEMTAIGDQLAAQAMATDRQDND